MACFGALFSRCSKHREVPSFARQQQKVADSPHPSGFCLRVRLILSYMRLPERSRAGILVLLKPV